MRRFSVHPADPTASGVNAENSQRRSSRDAERDRERDQARGSSRDLGEIVTDSIGNIFDYLHLRGILVRLEAREAGAELGKKVALLAAAGLFFAIGYFCLVAAAVAWAVASLDWSWPLAIAVAGGIHVTSHLLAFSSLPTSSSTGPVPRHPQRT